MTERLFVGTTPGLEGALATEARGLGAQVTPVEGGVELEGPLGLHQEANLRLRIASRVLLRVGHFQAPDARALEQGLRAVTLKPFWNGRGALEVTVNSHRSRLSSAGQIQALARKAWKLPPSGRPFPEAPELSIRLVDNACDVSVDTSGELLHRRGYRQEVSMAPLRETLAAGVLRLAGYSGDAPLWDPMCGSGTLPIEAAWIAMRRAPGRDRAFAFQKWPSFDRAAWKAKVDAAKGEERERPTCPIWATDIHAGALGTARRNGRRAGVGEALKLERQDAASISPLPGMPLGLVVANLPYGKRVGEKLDPAQLTRALGEALRQGFTGWRAALLSNDRRVPEWLGLEAEAMHPIDNGGISCFLGLYSMR